MPTITEWWSSLTPWDRYVATQIMWYIVFGIPTFWLAWKIAEWTTPTKVKPRNIRKDDVAVTGGASERRVDYGEYDR